MTKNNNTDYRKKIYRQRHHRRMKLVESGIGVVVAVIMIFALGQGNLKKNVNGQDEFQPESGTSADISESSTQDMSYSDTEGLHSSIWQLRRMRPFRISEMVSMYNLSITPTLM